MKCPVCQFENQHNLDFCEKCENEIGCHCPKCDNVNPSGSKFCNECGNDLRKQKKSPLFDYKRPYSYTPEYLAEKIRLTKNVIEGELKIVTVLFADMANSTALFENLDPEDVHDIMDGCFKIMIEEIHKYEGTITQFMGDGIMAIFGAPLAHEDHAQRACSATLEIQRALKAYSIKIHNKYHIEFKMRFGLNSGPVIVGAVGDDLRMDYTAEGDTVNLASRLETMAQPGTILVSSNIYNSTEFHFVFKALGKVKIKGKENVIDIFQLIDSAPQSLVSSERMIQSEMVGREHELNRLETLVQKAKNGNGSIVSIIGEAGIGKSRLIAELKKRETVKDTLFLKGRALSIGRNLSFYPIIEIIKNLANITDDITPGEAAYKLESMILTIYPEQAHEIFPFIATMMGLPLNEKCAMRVKGIEGEALEKLIQKNFRDLIARISESKTLVFIIEDLHWADTSSIELLKALFRLVKNNKILFVNLFRPYHKDTGETLLNTIIENYPALHTVIYIQPLDTALSDLLINNLLKIEGLPQNIRDLIHSRSEGNPFFIEEVVHSFIDKGAVVLKNGSFAITSKAESFFIPKDIQGLLMSRIDRLDNQSKSLVKIASVIGRTFFYKILLDVADVVDNIDEKLQHLERVQLIRRGKRLGEIEYLFKHALVQETAYESILRRKRKDLHLKVAESIEKNYGERLHEFYGMLVYHYSRGENIDKAEEYLIKAGEEALRASASSEALHFYQEALKLYRRSFSQKTDPNKMAMLEKNIAIAYQSKGYNIEATEHYDNALRYLGEITTNNKIVYSACLLSSLAALCSTYLFSLRHRNRVPTEKEQEIIELMFRRSWSMTLIDSKRFLIETLMLFKKVSQYDLSKVRNGLEIVGNSSILFSFTGMSFKLSQKLLDYLDYYKNYSQAKYIYPHTFSHFWLHFLSGNWHNLAINRNFIEKKVRSGDLQQVCYYLFGIILLRIEQGDFSSVTEHIKQIRQLSEMYDNELLRSIYYDVQAKYFMKIRKLNKALEAINKEIGLVQRINQAPSFIYTHGLKANIEILKNDLDKASDSLSTASHYSKLEPFLPPHYLIRYTMANFLYNVTRLEQSIIEAKEDEITRYKERVFVHGKRAIKNTHKWAGDRTEAFRLMGRCYWILGNQTSAIKWWKKSIAEGERLGACLELARTYHEIGERLSVSQSKNKAISGKNADDYHRKAAQLFKEMKLSPDSAIW